MVGLHVTIIAETSKEQRELCRRVELVRTDNQTDLLHPNVLAYFKGTSSSNCSWTLPSV